MPGGSLVCFACEPRLFALDVPILDVPSNCAIEDVIEAAEDHALAEADYVGIFARPS